jgi:hypothetical protein
VLSWFTLTLPPPGTQHSRSAVNIAQATATKPACHFSEVFPCEGDGFPATPTRRLPSPMRQKLSLPCDLWLSSCRPCLGCLVAYHGPPAFRLPRRASEDTTWIGGCTAEAGNQRCRRAQHGCMMGFKRVLLRAGHVD